MGLKLGLLVSTLAAISQAAPTALKPCGPAFYDESQYTCFDGTFLCPVLNGEATVRCGPDCYLPGRYSCDYGILGPALPSTPASTGPITLRASRLGSPFHLQPVQASGRAFLLNFGDGPSTYCPSVVTNCPPVTNATVLVCSNGGCSLNVEVPGGQLVYVASNGAMGFTQAHSSFIPPGSDRGGFLTQGNDFEYSGLSGAGFAACPYSGHAGWYQVFTSVPGLDSRCEKFEMIKEPFTGPGDYGAWQYT